MNPARWRQIEELYDSAAERTPEQRGPYLDEVCAGDAELRREVQSLLAHGDTPSTGVPPNPDYRQTPYVAHRAAMLRAPTGRAELQLGLTSAKDAYQALLSTDDGSGGLAPRLGVAFVTQPGPFAAPVFFRHQNRDQRGHRGDGEQRI